MLVHTWIISLFSPTSQEKLGSIITKRLVTGFKPSVKDLYQRDAQFYGFLEGLSV